MTHCTGTALYRHQTISAPTPHCSISARTLRDHRDRTRTARSLSKYDTNTAVPRARHCPLSTLPPVQHWTNTGQGQVSDDWSVTGFLLLLVHRRLWLERQEPKAMGGLCQGRLADCRTFIHMVEEIPRQGKMEGCHRMSAATHLIYGSESVY